MGDYSQPPVMSCAAAETAPRPADPDHVADVLHDLVGHHLVLLTAQTRIWREQGRGCGEADLARLAEMSESALRSLRRVSGLLRTGEVEKPSPTGFVHWMKELPARIPHEVADVSTTVCGSGRLDISPTQELLLERVVTEGVSNAAKHSAGGRVSIQFEFGDDIVVTIVTTGGPDRPAATDLDHGYGLCGLVLAVTRCGGRVTTRRRSAGHFTLEVRLPR